MWKKPIAPWLVQDDGIGVGLIHNIFKISTVSPLFVVYMHLLQLFIDLIGHKEKIKLIFSRVEMFAKNYFADFWSVLAKCFRNLFNF